MHSEYAVEPAAIGANWETFRFLIEKFGFDKGRLISRMPKRWEKKVITVAKDAGLSDVQRTKLVERLRHTKKRRVVDFGRCYDSNANWMANALEEHRKRPFRAIIGATEDAACSMSLTPDVCDDDHELIAAPNSRNVRRTADAIAGALLMFVYASREIDVVDPYFDINSRRPDYIGPLASLLKQLAELGDAGKTIRIHWRTHESRPRVEDLLRDATRRANGIIPQGFVLQLCEWEEVENGEDFHDRHVLSECGGITIGAGLAAVGAQEHTTFALHGDDHAASLRQRFSAGSRVYRKIFGVELYDDGRAVLL